MPDESRRVVPLLSYGFRPFFLLGAIFAPLGIAALLLGLGGVVEWPTDALPPFRWHGHEMIFGFVATALAGFLLTAVPTWTGTPPTAGRTLGALAALWVAGRIVVAPPLGLHATAAVLLDLAFFPALIAALAMPLIRTRNLRNLPFLLVLTLLFGADLLFHAVQAGRLASLPFDPLRFAANLVMLMIVIVGGRIVPAFTRNALIREGVGSGIRAAPWIDRAAISATGGVVVVDVVAQDTAASGAVAAAAAALLAVRLARWEGLRTLRMPIVWILHAGYAWVVVALALKASWLLAGVGWAANWLHALTAGAFGTMILAVTTRVALGHSGRPLRVRPAIVWAYALVIAGAAVRVWGAALPITYVHALACAMLLWGAAFVLFAVVYMPVLAGPRADQSA